MKISSLLFCLIITVLGNAQLLTWSPTFIQDNSTNIIITCDATNGNQGLNNYTPTTDVYVHMGVITSASANAADWKYSPFTWATTTANARATSLGNNKWQFTITGGIRAFLNITNANEKILKIAFLFRSGDGTKKLANTDGSDMYLPVYDNGTFVRIDNPLRTPLFTLGNEIITKSVGDNIAITANSNVASSLRILFNGTAVATANAATTISANPSIAATGNQQIIAEAVNGATTVRDTVNFLINGAVNIAALPTGVRDGINYEANATAATLVLFAPNKTRVAIIGDFNNWIETLASQMNRTPDGNRYWIRLIGLTSGQEYGFQYLVDGILKIADPYSEKVLDPNNDSFIPETTFPAAQRIYPVGKTTGIIGTLRTAKPAYNWQVNNFVKPDKRNLIIYELLVRDFVATQNYKTIQDTLSYLKRLGINTIQLMPINEFEGNQSWGYNPNYFLAPDKFYGTELALKGFIDECHKQGFAVVMDIALNHAFGSCPLVQLYWDAANGRPAANNPWLNPVAKHPFNVGYDFNHESQATKDFVDRVMEQWLVNFKIDGFRWDLSKGFTQTNYCTTTNCDGGSDVNNWSNYDAGRVAIWKRIYDKQQSLANNSYCILEHFATNSEEIDLSNYGMMLWGNLNNAFNQSAMGFTSNSDFSGGIFTRRGWINPFLITYQESHDEERLMYKTLQFGNSSGIYSTKDLNTALKRMEMTTAFWATIPGPKMLWQFGELGFDFSINRCDDGSINNNCRLANKPIKWDYYANANRRSLFDVYSRLLTLRNNPTYLSTFTSSNISSSLAGSTKWLIVNDANFKIVTIGNFDVAQQNINITFPTAGTWFIVFTGIPKIATGALESIPLQPGEYYVYTNINVSGMVPTSIFSPNNILNNMKVSIAPNPMVQSSVVSYNLLETGNVNISLLDISGRKVAQLFNGYKLRGNQTVTINKNAIATNVVSATYLLQIEVNGKKKIEKISIQQ